jgi:hypothetical protein
MITVSILINGQPIFTRSAVRTLTGKMNHYKCDDGTVIRHDYNHGAVRLAMKMLKTIKEPRQPDSGEG